MTDRAMTPEERAIQQARAWVKDFFEVNGNFVRGVPSELVAPSGTVDAAAHAIESWNKEGRR